MGVHTRRSFLAAASSAAISTALPSAVGQSPADLTSLTLAQASNLLRDNKVSSVELTDACLNRIAAMNHALNAFITVTGPQAREAARQMDRERAQGKRRGPLHGIPIAIKDNIDTAGIRTTAASGVFKDRVPTEDAQVVRKLKLAGAVSLGKLNLHEFADGGTSTISYFGPVHNPWALDHISGGSSGGSAAATAAHLCFATLGTDTLGSVRMPASYCGVVGFKPTYGRVSLRGVIPLSWTLDHLGPITRTVEDAALMLNALAGYDPFDPATVNVPVPDYAAALATSTRNLRLGIPRTPFFDALDPEVSSAVETAIAVLRPLVASIRNTQLPPIPPFGPILGTESYAYHAKFLAESPGLYQSFTRDRLLSGANIPAATYAHALRQTYLVRRDIVRVFSDLDLVVTPTMRRTAEAFTESKTFDPLGVRNTSPFDVFGLPSITVPCGFSRAGLPIGLQISGAPFAESTVIALAHAYERQTQWHTMHPNLASA
jgi:aspartyl-tRNA(Asn)/glutamyl-tRNA(Gln) amidotransferase subunit A